MADLKATKRSKPQNAKPENAPQPQCLSAAVAGARLWTCGWVEGHDARFYGALA